MNKEQRLPHGESQELSLRAVLDSFAFDRP